VGSVTMRVRTILLSLILFLMFTLACAEEKSLKVCFKNVCVSAETASTPEEKQRGLMFRKDLGELSGMLFINQREGIYSFWMKNTLIPLDIIWISRNKKVVFIEKDAQPCLKICEAIKPTYPAQYILEVNAGFVEKYQIKVGQRLDF